MGLTRRASRTRSDRSVGLLFYLSSGEDILPASSPRRPRPRPRPRLRHGVERSEDEYHPPSSVPQRRARRVYSLLQRARRRRSRALRRVGRGEELRRVVLVPLRRLVPRGDERLRLRRSFPPPATSTVVKTTASIFARTISRRNPTWSLSAAIATTAAIFVARGKTSRRRRRRRRRLGRVRAVRHQPPTRIVPGHDHLEAPRGFGAFESASHVFVVDGPPRSSVSILRRAPPRVKTRRRRARGARSRVGAAPTGTCARRI